MTNQQQYEQNPAFIHRQIVDEMVLVPIHQNVVDMESVYTLNTVGASIWSLLKQPASHTELKSALLDEYDVDPDLLEADLIRFINEMLAINAIRMM